MSEIALYLPGILLAYSAFLLAIACPGPNVLAVIGASMGVNRASQGVLGAFFEFAGLKLLMMGRG